MIKRVVWENTARFCVSRDKIAEIYEEVEDNYEIDGWEFNPTVKCEELTCPYCFGTTEMFTCDGTVLRGGYGYQNSTGESCFKCLSMNVDEKRQLRRAKMLGRVPTTAQVDHESEHRKIPWAAACEIVLEEAFGEFYTDKSKQVPWITYLKEKGVNLENLLTNDESWGINTSL